MKWNKWRNVHWVLFTAWGESASNEWQMNYCYCSHKWNIGEGIFFSYTITVIAPTSLVFSITFINKIWLCQFFYSKYSFSVFKNRMPQLLVLKIWLKSTAESQKCRVTDERLHITVFAKMVVPELIHRCDEEAKLLHTVFLIFTSLSNKLSNRLDSTWNSVIFPMIRCYVKLLRHHFDYCAFKRCGIY